MLPEPPTDLVESLRAGNVVAVVGSGLSCAAGYPSWVELLQGLCDAALRLCPHDRTRIASAWQAIVHDPLGAAALLLGVLDTQFAPAVVHQLSRRQTFVAHHSAIAKAVAGRGGGLLWKASGSDAAVCARPTLSHRLLVQLGLRVIITTNYDSLLEDSAPEGARPAVYSWSARDVPNQLAKGVLPMILKLHGDTAHPRDIILARKHYSGEQSTSATRAAVGALMATSRPLWVGYGHKDPDLDLLLDAARSLGVTGGFAIVSRPDPILLDRLLDAEIFPIRVSEHADVPRFLHRLALAAGRPTSFPIQLRAAWPDERTAATRKLELSNLLSDFGVYADPWNARAGTNEVLYEATAEHVNLLDGRLRERSDSLLRRLAEFGVVACNWRSIEPPSPMDPPRPPLLRPAAPSRPSRLPRVGPSPNPSSVAAVHVSKPQYEAPATACSPEEMLRDLLVSLFDVEGLKRFVSDLAGYSMVARIAFAGVAPVAAAHEVVEKLKADGLVTPQLFEALCQRVPGRAPAITAAHHRWYPRPTDERNTLLSRLLDRDWAWRRLIAGCEENKDPVFFLLHGTPRQGLAQFLERVGRYLHGEDIDSERVESDPEEHVHRDHLVFEIQYMEGHSPARTLEEWRSRFLRKVRSGSRTLRDSLARMLTDNALMFVIRGHDSEPLRAMDAADTAVLAAFLGEDLPAILGAIRAQPRALRVLVPVEHAPCTLGHPPEDSLWASLDLALQRAEKNGVTRVVLPELVYPHFHEVEDSIRKFLRRRIPGFKGIPADTLNACMAVHAARPESNYRDLADALYRVLEPLLA